MTNLNDFNAFIGFDDAEEEVSVKNILDLAGSYRDKNEYHAANILYRRAAGTSARGQIEYSRFLMNVSYDKNLSWKDRFRMAESLLLPLSNSENKNRSIDACILLSTLYSRCNLKLSAFGYLLRAHNLAGTVDEQEVERLAREIEKMSIHEGTRDPHGGYITGMELSTLNSSILHERAEYLLQLAVENGKGAYVGIAALQLAEMLKKNQANAAVINHYMEIAALHGNPEIPM